MNFLLSQINAADRAAVNETNAQKLDRSLAFCEIPTIDPATGVANVITGPPTAGSHVVGELWLDQNVAKYRCTVTGTPGTWIQVAPAVVEADPAGIPDNYVIARTVEYLKMYRWDGAAWQAV
ncbi:MAG TPA: hypothetical protein VGO57_14300 [Verrucomicrobiae bacterium]|jgi:hypothetical protein